MPQPLNPQELAQAQQRFQGITGDELTSRYRQFQQYQQGGFRDPNFQANYNAGQTYNEPITTDSLRPVTPYTLPTPQTPTAAAGAVARFQEGAQQKLTAYQQLVAEDVRRREQAQKESAATRKKDIEEYLGVLGSKGRLQEEQDIAGKSEAITAARKQVNEYNNQLIQEQTALNRQIETIQTNPNLTKEQAQPQIEEAQRKSARKQADISLSRLSASVALEGANLDLATANSIIQTKIDTELEPLKIKLQYNKEIDDRLFTSFTEAEKRLWAEVKAEDQRIHDTTEKDKTAAYELWKSAVTNGSPQATSQAILKAINEGDYDRVRELSAPYLAKPGKADQFTLRPGEVRYDAQGRIIARGAPRTGTAGATFSIAEVDKYGLPRSLAGASERTIISQMQVPQIPDWFRQKAEQELQMSLLPNVLQQMWDDFRTKFLTGEGGAETTTGETESEIVNPFR